MSEGFSYDALNRLTESTVTTSGDPVAKFFSYDSVGNLLLKSDVGNYAYPEPGLARPHDVLSIDGDEITATFSYDPNGNQTGANGSSFNRTVTYSSYNKPSCIQQGASAIGFYDDVDHQRFQLKAYGSSSCATATGTTNYFDAFGVPAEVSQRQRRPDRQHHQPDHPRLHRPGGHAACRTTGMRTGVEN